MLSVFTVTSINTTSFALLGSCLISGALAAGESCFFTANYAPTVIGSLSAQVDINDNAPNTPQIITLARR